jgi:hypothetical protein
MLSKVLAVAAGLGLMLAFAGGASAEETKKSPSFKGTVKVVKGDDGKVTSVTLVVKKKDEETTYTLTGDKTKDLEALDGKVVYVTGAVTEKDGKKSIAVESFKEVPAKKTDATK